MRQSTGQNQLQAAFCKARADHDQNMSFVIWHGRFFCVMVFTNHYQGYVHEQRHVQQQTGSCSKART